MILSFLLGFDYHDSRNDAESFCSGSHKDLEKMYNFMQGVKYIFSDISLPNSFIVHSAEEIFVELRDINYQDVSLVLFYFTGHGEDGHIKISSEYIPLLSFLEFFDSRLSSTAEIVFLCDCCGMNSNPLKLPFLNHDSIQERFIARHRVVFLIAPSNSLTTGNEKGSYFTSKLCKQYEKNPYSTLPGNIYSSYIMRSSIPLTVPQRVGIVDRKIYIKKY